MVSKKAKLMQDWSWFMMNGTSKCCFSPSRHGRNSWKERRKREKPLLHSL